MRSPIPYIAALAATFCFLSPALSYAADCVVPAGNNAVTLRSGPSADSAAAGTIVAGRPLPLVASLKGWYEVRVSADQTAFAAKRGTNTAACPGPAAATAPAQGARFELHAIDVGTGLSIFVRGPDFTLLYDAGSNDDIARGPDNRVVSYLKTLTPEVANIDHIILSHPHRDHVELLPDVIKTFPPRNVWNSGAYNDICGYRNFLLAISANPAIQYHTATQDSGPENWQMAAKTCYGEKQLKQPVVLQHAKRIDDSRIPIGRDAAITFLYADGTPHESANENSLVMRLDLGTHHVLFMGDAEAGGRKSPQETPLKTSIEGKLLECCVPDLAADLLIAGHHGSKTSSRDAFLDKVGAKFFVVSAGPTKYGKVTLPDEEIVTDLERRGTVYRTDLEDDACAKAPDKIGPVNDGRPGGCENIVLVISPSGIAPLD